MAKPELPEDLKSALSIAPEVIQDRDDRRICVGMDMKITWPNSYESASAHLTLSGIRCGTEEEVEAQVEEMISCSRIVFKRMGEKVLEQAKELRTTRNGRS